MASRNLKPVSPRGSPPRARSTCAPSIPGGNIVIQIQDDGNGLAKGKLLAKAQEKGIVKSGQTLSDKEIYDLIFAPGFSTAETITDISGRGVGMDVVGRNIEKLRGKVDIDTVLGQGTTFTIYLPLTLAIIDGLIVSVGGRLSPLLRLHQYFDQPTKVTAHRGRHCIGHDHSERTRAHRKGVAHRRKTVAS